MIYRYQTMIRFLREQGAEVLVVTTGPGVTLPGYDFSAACEQPSDYHGAKVISCYSVGCPFYWSMPLSFALSPRIYKAVADFQPDLIHCSSPGLMVGAAWIYSRLLRLPLVKAYHTHIPAYLPRYGLSFLVNAMWSVLRFLHAAAHLTLTTSAQMLTELKGQRVAADRHIDVWKRGVDSDLFHPSYKCAAMRRRLTAGHPEDPVMIYCGRLGSEKNLTFLKGILERVPNLRLAFVGDGPSRGDLERHFRGTKTVFLGMLHGEELSQAYASGDLFAMPSESETLGFVVLEAMSAGLPVVAVRAGGLPDIIQRDGETGFLYESGDVTRAAELTRRLVEDPALRARIGAAAREEVSRWDWMAATRHLLLEQYPKAVRAARSYFGAKFRSPMIKGERAAVL